MVHSAAGTLRGRSPCCRQLALVLAVLLSCAAGYAQRELKAASPSNGPGPPTQGKPAYVSLFVAMLALPEGKYVTEAYFNTFKGISKGSPFEKLLDLVQSQSAEATWFWPEDNAWADTTWELCMSVEKVLDTISSAPAIAVQFCDVHVVPGRTVLKDDFTDGLTMQTLEPGYSLKLAKREVDGKTQWYFPGAALNGSDVIILRTDITAGAEVAHIIDRPIFDDAQRKFWIQQRQNIGEQGCREYRNQTGAAAAGSSAVNAGMIAGIVVAAVLALGLLLLLLYVLRRKSPLRQRLSETFHRAPKDSGPDEAAMQCETADTSGHNVGHKDVSDVCPPITATKDPAVVLQAGALQPPVTPITTPTIARSMSATCESDASCSTSASQAGVFSVQLDDVGMTPVFEANPVVPASKLESWVQHCAGRGGSAGGHGNDRDATSSSGSSGRAAAFSAQIRRETDRDAGNPNIINNYTNFTREVEHSSTAVYFCDGMHNNRQFALKFYARQDDFQAEMKAYKELGGINSKYVPVLEMSYPGSGAYPTSVLVFERGQCTLEAFARQRPTYWQQIDILHQLVSAVQHLHDHSVVHRDMKPSNVVHFPEKFAWKLIDLATIARDGEYAKIVYTREYCSPEVAQAVVSGAGSMTVNAASDLWGVGVIMYELATGHRYFPPDWSLEGGKRIWSALCGFEALPHEMVDITLIRGADKGVMKLVRRLLQRDPQMRPTPRQLLNERVFQARGNTTTQVSQGSNVSHGSTGSGHL